MIIQTAPGTNLGRLSRMCSLEDEMSLVMNNRAVLKYDLDISCYI